MQKEPELFNSDRRATMKGFACRASQEVEVSTVFKHWDWD